MDDLFKCEIEEMDVPLGVILQGPVTGLDIIYELTDDTLEKLMTNRMSDTISVNSLALSQNSSIISTKTK